MVVKQFEMKTELNKSDKSDLSGRSDTPVYISRVR